MCHAPCSSTAFSCYASVLFVPLEVGRLVAETLVYMGFMGLASYALVLFVSLGVGGADGRKAGTGLYGSYFMRLTFE